MRTLYTDIEPFCAEVLRARVADGGLPPGDVWQRDICTLTAEELAPYSQVHLFAGIGGSPLGLKWAGWPAELSIVTGGFPCQDISVAGKGEGIGGARSGLWKEMYRVIDVVRPSWVLTENVPALRTRGIDTVLGDLEALGYTATAIVVGADDLGAPHRRKRVWIVGRMADTHSGGLRQQSGRRRGQGGAGASGVAGTRGVADAIGDGRGAGGGVGGDESGAGGGRSELAGGGEPGRGRIGVVGGSAEDLGHTNGVGRARPDENRSDTHQNQRPKLSESGGGVCGQGRAEQDADRPVGGDGSHASAGSGELADPAGGGCGADGRARDGAGHADECGACGYAFDHAARGKYGCPNCLGDAPSRGPKATMLKLGHGRGTAGDGQTGVARGAGSCELGDTEPARLEGHGPDSGQPQQPQPRYTSTRRWPAGPGQPQHDWEAQRLVRFVEREVGGPVDGLSVRLARAANRHSLKALGNSQVPQCVEIIARAILTQHQST